MTVASGTYLEGDGLQVLCLSFLLCPIVMRILAAHALLSTISGINSWPHSAFGMRVPPSWQVGMGSQPLLAATFGSLSWVPAVYQAAGAGFTWVRVRFLQLRSLQWIARGQGGWGSLTEAQRRVLTQHGKPGRLPGGEQGEPG